MVVTARYYRVSPQYWHLSRDWEDRLRLLGLYVQTCEHRTTEGLYRLPTAYIVGDLGWPLKTVEQRLGDLEATGYVKYDAAAEVILLVDALEVQAPITPDQVTGAIRRLKSVPPSSLMLALFDLASTHASGLAAAMRVEFGVHPYEYYVELNGGNHCGICGRTPEAEKKLHRDHEHKGVGTPRGLLCFPCNLQLKHTSTMAWLTAAAAYLERVEARRAA